MAHWRGLVAGFGVIAAVVAGDATAQTPQVVALGTGDVAAVYFPVGLSVCRLMNLARAEHGIRYAAEPTAGSVANVAALRAGELDFAIVQSDVQAAAVAGTGPFADGAFPDLRAVMALHAEPLTIVARADRGIGSIDDLAGKRVALGEAGSGQRALMQLYMAERGWTTATFAGTAELAPMDLADALCAGRVDAFVYAIGHPALVVQEATTACDTRIAAATGPAVEALLAQYPSYRTATIPGGLYRGTPRDVPTFGVQATLVTRADVADAVVRALVAGVFENFDMLRALHPALAPLDAATMAARPGPAPLHPGAAAYYRERGWID